MSRERVWVLPAEAFANIRSHCNSTGFIRVLPIWTTACRTLASSISIGSPSPRPWRSNLVGIAQRERRWGRFTVPTLILAAKNRMTPASCRWAELNVTPTSDVNAWRPGGEQIVHGRPAPSAATGRHHSAENLSSRPVWQSTTLII